MDIKYFQRNCIRKGKNRKNVGDPMNVLKQMLQKAFLVLSTPSKFFEKIRNEKEGLIEYLVLISLVFSILFAALFTVHEIFIGVGRFFIIGLIMAFASGFIVTLGIVFLETLIIHFFALIFRCKRGYNNTAKAVVYGNTPTFLFSWIPFVTIIATIYCWAITVIGISKLHNVSIKKAIFVVVPISIVIIYLSILVMGYDSILGPFASEILHLS